MGLEAPAHSERVKWVRHVQLGGLSAPSLQWVWSRISDSRSPFFTPPGPPNLHDNPGISSAPIATSNPHLVGVWLTSHAARMRTLPGCNGRWVSLATLKTRQSWWQTLPGSSWGFTSGPFTSDDACSCRTELKLGVGAKVAVVGDNRLAGAGQLALLYVYRARTTKAPPWSVPSVGGRWGPASVGDDHGPLSGRPKGSDLGAPPPASSAGTPWPQRAGEFNL